MDINEENGLMTDSVFITINIFTHNTDENLVNNDSLKINKILFSYNKNKTTQT